MEIIKRYLPCENLARFNEKYLDKTRPERARAFGLLLARQQLYLGRYEDYKETKTRLYEENTIRILAAVMKITSQITEYHAKRGEVETIMALVGEGIVPEMQALRVLLENRCYSDYEYLANKFNITQKEREELVYYLLIELYREGKTDIADEVIGKKLVSEATIYDIVNMAKERARSQKKEDGKFWAARMLMNAAESTERPEYGGNSFLKTILGPIDAELNRAKKDSAQ